MPFGSYLQIGQIAKAYQITWAEGDFVVPFALPSVSEALREGLEFAAHVGASGRSEFARCENYIYPILKEVWRYYLKDLMLWSHEPLRYDDDLSGTPDYFLARMSPLGPVVMEEPYLMVMEAKRDDFDKGWAQCLAAMLAAQRLNPTPQLVVHGIVTTGNVWEFGKLEGQTFVLDQRRYTASDLEELLAAVRFLFEQCLVQLRRWATAA